MAGRRPKRPRSGDLSEALGLYLLRFVGAVAPVPRPDDVGIDAIVTLLNETDDEQLIAEESFYVQLKTVSEWSILYEPHEVKWLSELKLPYFIGTIDKQAAGIAIYPIHDLHEMLARGNFKRTRIYLRPPKRDQRGDDEYHFVIDNPLLAWTCLDFARDDFGDFAYHILKPFVVTEQRNIGFRAIKYVEPIRWNTNEPPELPGGYSLNIDTASEEDMRRICETMAPQIHALACYSLATKNPGMLEDVLRIISHMRKAGFDPDRKGIWPGFLELLRQRLASRVGVQERPT
jgi:hypothetical protein